MTEMINFGIDLGTTNSLVAKFEKGAVEVFKNPNGFKETLPSIVGFRNDRILIGDQARAYAERDPGSVASRFKRKLGTTESIKIKSLNQSKTPVELSAFVLKELKNFVHSGEQIPAAVITIPASFDTVQSNATKEAGLQAGFKEVVLLQEPIAASLAYANKEKQQDLRNSQWIVYDLGGGTFDVALVRIVEGELTVVDHEGDNYLGGSDFDSLIVEKLLVPQIEQMGKFTNLLSEMRSESGKYNKLWTILLHKAEEAKIELTTKTSAEIDLGMIRDLEDEDGNEIDTILTITRTEFEGVIRPSIDGTAEMMKKILTRNSLRSEDLQFVLMVGGSTYTPYVRSRINELMNIPVSSSIDPTNAIATGAAYYAGAKAFTGEMKSDSASDQASIKLKAVYNRNSQENEEMFTAKIEGDFEGYFYRITSDDGAFDTGLKSLTKRITEDLPLRECEYNLFTLKVLDPQNNPVDVGFDSIQIAQGRYSVAGQMLPEDICLVRDDLSLKDTRLDNLFAKNSVLPTRAKRTVEVGKTVHKNSSDAITIIVVEGPSERHSSTNKPIGILQITGDQLSRDLLRGTEIDLIVDLSESRDLTVSAYLNGTGQDFSQVFSGKAREVNPRILATEVLQLEETIQKEIDEAQENGQQENASKLNKLRDDIKSLIVESAALSDDDVTDDKFKIEDSKRKVAQNLYDLTSSKRLETARREYVELKSEVAELVRNHGSDREKHRMQEIIGREELFVHSTNPEKLESLADELQALRFEINMRQPDFLLSLFGYLIENRTTMSDQTQAGILIEHGKNTAEKADWDKLKEVVRQLWLLMPDDMREESDVRLYTGIV